MDYKITQKVIVSLKIFLIIFIVAAGLFLRLAGLDYGLPSKNMALTTYHPDEPLSFYTIEKWKPEKLYFHPGRAILWGGFHLFPMAAGLKTAQIAGYVKFGNRDFYVSHLKESDKLYRVARLLQVFCGVASLLVVFWLAAETFGWTAGMLSALFLCLSAVHIVNSFLTRPDAMMVFFALLCLLFTARVWQKPDRRFSILAGVFLGLAAASKYNAAPFGIFPLLIHWFSPEKENRKNLIFCLSAGAASFLLGCPYLILDFPWFRQQMLLNVALVKSSIVPVKSGPGWITYFTTFLPYGLGWPLSLAGFAGAAWVLGKSIRKKVSGIALESGDHLGLIWVLCCVIVYVVITLPKSQQVWYTLPVVPLIAIFAAVLCADLVRAVSVRARVLGLAFCVFISSYTAVYALAYLSLFRGQNVREEASEWIDRNIPKGESIGIVRSYFWTPGILRQYHPPYRLLQGGDDQSFTDDAVLGMEEVAQEARYLVLSEYEYRTYLYPEFSARFPRQAEILKKVMEKDYREIARFDREARFLSFRFPKKEFPPFDWFLPNPTIRIFRKSGS